MRRTKPRKARNRSKRISAASCHRLCVDSGPPTRVHATFALELAPRTPGRSTRIEEQRVHSGNRKRAKKSNKEGHGQEARNAYPAGRTSRSMADVAHAGGHVADRDLPPAVVDLAFLPADASDPDWAAPLLRAPDSSQLPARAWLERLLAELGDHLHLHLRLGGVSDLPRRACGNG